MTDVRISWAELDAAAQPVHVAVSFVEFDVVANPRHVALSFAEFDATQPVGITPMPTVPPANGIKRWYGATHHSYYNPELDRFEIPIDGEEDDEEAVVMTLLLEIAKELCH